MAISKAKRSRSSAQSRATKPASPTTPRTSKKPQQRKKPRRRLNLTFLPPAVITRQGKTSIHRFASHPFHRMEEVKAEIPDYAGFFTSREYHCISIGFQDRQRHDGAWGVKQDLLCIQ
jgi:hypothetical protein